MPNVRLSEPRSQARREDKVERMARLPELEAAQLSVSQRSAIRNAICDTIAVTNIEAAVRETSVKFQKMYGTSVETAEYVAAWFRSRQAAASESSAIRTEQTDWPLMRD